VNFSVDLDISGAVKLTNAIAKQIPFAMAKALRQRAIQAQTDFVQAMIQVSDRPTPYTLNSCCGDRGILIASTTSSA
jgi:hypothetical protein